MGLGFIQTQPFSNCVTLGQSLKSPQAPCSSINQRGRLNKIMCVKPQYITYLIIVIHMLMLVLINNNILISVSSSWCIIIIINHINIGQIIIIHFCSKKNLRINSSSLECCMRFSKSGYSRGRSEHSLHLYLLFPFAHPRS